VIFRVFIFSLLWVVFSETDQDFRWLHYLYHPADDLTKSLVLDRRSASRERAVRCVPRLLALPPPSGWRRLVRPMMPDAEPWVRLGFFRGRRQAAHPDQAARHDRTQSRNCDRRNRNRDYRQIPSWITMS
jgi:hypothetical protein